MRQQFLFSEILLLLKRGVIIQSYHEEGDFLSLILRKLDNNNLHVFQMAFVGATEIYKALKTAIAFSKKIS